MCDGAGAILQALEIVYGEDVHAKLVTYQAHHKASIERRKRQIRDKETKFKVGKIT